MKRWISAVPIALGAMLLIGCGVRAGLAAKQNGEVINGFKRVEYSSGQYEQGLPMEQIDFQKCAAANVTLGNYGKGKSYVLQTTLHFFDSPSSPVPAVTLEKGTEIYSRPPVALNARGEPEYNIPEYGYGFFATVPTYQREWRYTRLPMKTGEEGFAGEQPYFYLRTGEVMQEMKRYLAQENSDASPEETALAVDALFYERGAYLSPNLLVPEWDCWSSVLTAAGACAVVAGLLVLFARRKAGRRKE